MKPIEKKGAQSGGIRSLSSEERVTTEARQPIGTLIAQSIATADKHRRSWLAWARLGQVQKFLETKVSESRLTDGYCALEGSRMRDIQNKRM